MPVLPTRPRSRFCAAHAAALPPGEELRRLREAVHCLADLVVQLSGPQADERPHRPHPAPASGRMRRWEEQSVVELRALLRSYPIDRRSLPAPIELLRREELLEALAQVHELVG